MPHLFHEAWITLNTKSDKDVTKKTQLQTNIQNQIQKSLTKYQQIEFKSVYIKGMIHHGQSGLSQKRKFGLIFES